jgi:N-acetylmuramoyl-L-alanine amidase
MVNFGKVFVSALALVLAGCATPSDQKGRRARDWQSEKFAAAPMPPNKPAPAPAPSSVTAPANPAFNDVQHGWVSLNRWCEVNRLPLPVRMAVVPMPLYSLATTNGRFVLRAGSQAASRDGLEFRLGFAPQMIDGQLWLHALDLQKNLHPLINDPLLPVIKLNRTIVIDPGHGGENAGTRSVLGNRYEKEFTLDWAMRLAPLLTTVGWQVFLTRTNDTDLALSNRVNFADAHKADLFVSLHFNSASPDATQAGLETYCLTPAGMPSTVTRGYNDDPALLFANNTFDEQNLLLAYNVHRALLRASGSHDRGVRRARFPGVLRGQQRPAILVEGGYLSNPHEAELITEPAYRQKLAEAVAWGLCGMLPSPVETTDVASRRTETLGQNPESLTPKATTATP